MKLALFDVYMESKKVLVTSYENPDVDGTGCSYAYSDFLQNKNIDAQAGFFGKPHREAQFVIDKFNIKINNAENLIDEYKDVIFLDASEVLRLPQKIKPEQIVEIIDHRKSEDTDKFPNAKIQIELVGSCATLIAEKFEKENMEISKESAVLLYSAIISNTLNFQGRLTTNRDKKMAEWLKKQIELPEDYVHQMFVHKSKFTQPLKDVLLGDFKDFQINDDKIGIAQLEIVDVDDFINNNLEETKKLLSEIKKEKSSKYIFLNCIDLENGFNAFVAIDDLTKKVISSSLNVNFEDDIAKSDHLIMRKEMVPLIKEVLRTGEFL